MWMGRKTVNIGARKVTKMFVCQLFCDPWFGLKNWPPQALNWSTSFVSSPSKESIILPVEPLCSSFILNLRWLVLHRFIFFNSGYTNIKGKLVQRAHWVLYFNDGDGALNRPAKMSLTGSTSDPQNCFGSEVQKPKNWTIERFNPSLRIGGTAALTTELRLAFFVTGVVPSCLLWAGYNVAALWGLSRLDRSAAGGSLLPFSGLGGSGFPAPVLKFSEWWWLLSIACKRSPESAWYAPLL